MKDLEALATLYSHSSSSVSITHIMGKINAIKATMNIKNFLLLICENLWLLGKMSQAILSNNDFISIFDCELSFFPKLIS